MAATATQNAAPAQRGDEEALYRAHHTRLLCLVARDVSARPQVIEDACAYAWAELLARQPERTSIVGWLRVVARHEAIRLALSDRPLVSMGVVDPDRLPGPAARASGGGDRHEAVEALTLLAALPERKRTFLAAKVAGYSYGEIADQLGVSWRTVNRQLVRARTAVRRARDVA